MKKLFIGALLLSLSLGAFAQYQREDGAQTAGNAPWEQIASQRRQLFNFDWKFRLGQVAGAADPALDDSAWRSLDLPHDFQFEQPWIENGRGSRAFKPMVEGWYRKHFSADPSWRGKRVSLVFDGVIFVSDVYVNGEKVGSGEYGYVGYEVDITDRLRYDAPNVVAVYASSGPEGGSRWYTGAGIFRDVHLEVKNPTHIVRNGIFVTTPEVSASRATVALQVEVDGYQGHDASIRARIL
ncbi:MAG: beta-galactosidase, partial [Bacteroidales bacterium]|nr:beta-galactosidase [Bacteroidales bacterium]